MLLRAPACGAACWRARRPADVHDPACPAWRACSRRHRAPACVSVRARAPARAPGGQAPLAAWVTRADPWQAPQPQFSSKLQSSVTLLLFSILCCVLTTLTFRPRA